MTKLKRSFVRKLLGWLVAGMRKGWVPRGLACAVLGGAVLALGQSDDVPIKTCYKPILTNMGPVIMGLTARPNPTGGADTVRVEAVLVDRKGRLVSGATLFVGEYGISVAMKARDGAFDSDSEGVYLDLDVSEFPVGTTRIYVEAWDPEGKRGTASLDLEITD